VLLAISSIYVSAVLVFPPVPTQVILPLSKLNKAFSELEFLMLVWVTFYREEGRSKTVSDGLKNAVNLVVTWNYSAGISQGLQRHCSSAYRV